ncbi:hypothetical protein AVEN_208339-1, partial [Araneus ventricosus]
PVLEQHEDYFGADPRHFETLSDDEGDARAGIPCPGFRTTPGGGRSTHCVLCGVQ